MPEMNYTPKLRALRVALLTPLHGATPAARQSRFHSVPGMMRAFRASQVTSGAVESLR